jgi:UDP-4-amino-4,6-dideoxy-N-acetyl-beta-L-altrosamine transaminase
MIPYARQEIDDGDVAAVIDVLRSDFLTQGPAVERFESAVASWCGAGNAVAVTNATAALHVAVHAAGLRAGGLLWTSPNSFVASANCALYCGADVDFVDIEGQTGNMSVAALEAKLVAAEVRGRLPDVVVPVDFGGQPCDLREMRALADRFGFAIVEDASHAIGATYRERRIGDGTFADATVFSFHPVKIITTGEGGMVLTNRDALAQECRLLRTHGITRDRARMVASPIDGPSFYQQIELGFNYRITDLQAALGMSQFARLDAFLERRHAIAARYDRELAALAVRPLTRYADRRSALHLYVVHVEERDRVFAALEAARVRANVHYIPIHLQPFYRERGFALGDFPEAERHYLHAISLPMFVGLTDDAQTAVIAALSAAL